MAVLAVGVAGWGWWHATRPVDRPLVRLDVDLGVEVSLFGQIDAIGVDEIQYAKGHKYLTLVYQIDLGVTRLLWVGKERTIESFQGFFTVIGDELASKIAFVCSICGSPISKSFARNVPRRYTFSTASTSWRK